MNFDGLAKDGAVTALSLRHEVSGKLSLIPKWCPHILGETSVVDAAVCDHRVTLFILARRHTNGSDEVTVEEARGVSPEFASRLTGVFLRPQKRIDGNP